MCVRPVPPKRRKRRPTSSLPWRLDGRRWEAKRYKAIYGALLAPLGGDEGASEADKVLARTAASLSVRLELLTAAMCRGEALACEYDSIADRCGRAVKRLRNKAATAEKPSEPLSDYLKRRAASAA
jgi:hypothetical protein